MAQYNTVILGVFQLDFGGKSIQFSIESETEPTCMRYNALSDLSWSIVYVSTSIVQFKGGMVMIAVKFKFS